MAKTKPEWRNRIVGEGVQPASQFLANSLNFRRHPANQREALRGSLSELGWIQRVVVNRTTGNVVDGHARIEEALTVGDETPVPFIEVELSEGEEKLALAILDPISAMAIADKEALDSLLREVSTGDESLQKLLSDVAEREGLYLTPGEGAEGGAGASTLPLQPEDAKKTLADRFLVPPFSVLDARQGYWQDRKRAWLALGIQSELGRGDTSTTSARVGPNDAATYRTIGGSKKNGLLGESEQSRSHYKNAAPGGTLRPAMSLGDDGKTVRGDGKGKPMASGLARSNGQDLMRGEHVVGETASLKGGLVHGTTIHPYDGSSSEVQSGTSIFDPVLCELAVRWFSPPDGAIFDPFAGGSVRGIVAAILGRQYTGIDLRAEQIAANEVQAKTITPANLPRWIVGDSRNAGTLAKGEYDFIFSCPPYADLEVYSDNPADLSTLKYADFLLAYRQIIAASVAMLKPNRFACFVVGDVRDKKGFYYNFVSDTIGAFQDAGAKLYNEAILVTSVGSLPIRVGRQFESGRKLGKTHQNVLVFLKGDSKKAVADCGTVEVHDPAEDFGEVVE